MFQSKQGLVIAFVILVGFTMFFVMIMSGTALGFLAFTHPEVFVRPDTGEASTACGTGVDTLVPGYDMLPVKRGEKLGHEEHLTNTHPKHYCGKDSGNCSAFAGGGAFAPHTTEQERYYFNTRWGGWIWHHGGSISLDNKKGAREARKKVKHAKLIITSAESGRSMVVSAEESGPAVWVTDRDGVLYGAPPEVYGYLKTSNPYTGNPNDGKGKIEVKFAQDQNVKLGPCK